MKMKWIAIFILILVSSVLLGCKSKSVENGNNIYEKDPDPTKTSELDKIINVLIPEQELVYRNEAAGYQLTFPENWRGYYVITEYGSEEVCIGFYGKSKTGQIYFKQNWGQDGLDLFWIKNEPCPECPIKKIGEANGVEYFFIEHGGSFIGILSAISYPDRTDRELAKYEIDETELELAAQDWEKAKSMYEEIDDVVKSFTPIK